MKKPAAKINPLDAVAVINIKRFFRKPGSIGSAPGTLVSVARDEQRPLLLTIFEYGSERESVERRAQSIADCLPFSSQMDVTWLSVDGSHQVSVLEAIGARLEIHPLVLEDILDTSQRPKMEDYERYIFIELNMLLWHQGHARIESEQISLILLSIR